MLLSCYLTSTRSAEIEMMVMREKRNEKQLGENCGRLKYRSSVALCSKVSNSLYYRKPPSALPANLRYPLKMIHLSSVHREIIFLPFPSNTRTHLWILKKSSCFSLSFLSYFSHVIDTNIYSACPQTPYSLLLSAVVSKVSLYEYIL